MDNQPDLLIIGAGPVGLTLACEAVRHGLSVRILDERENASIHSKAQLVHARTLELLDDMGISDRFEAQGRMIHSFSIYSSGGKKRIANMVIEGLDSRFQGMLSIPQYETELLLADRLRELGVEVERKVRLDRFSQDDHGVQVTLVHEGDGNREESVTVPWMAGCDGAHSTVRSALDLPFEGHKYPVHIIQTDSRVDLAMPVHDDEVIAFAGVGGMIALFPLPTGENRYRFLLPRPEQEEIEPTLNHFQDALNQFAPPGSKVSDPKWMAGFRIHCRMVPRLRVGRVFLSGDASHIHSPAGGVRKSLLYRDGGFREIREPDSVLPDRSS